MGHLSQPPHSQSFNSREFNRVVERSVRKAVECVIAKRGRRHIEDMWGGAWDKVMVGIQAAPSWEDLGRYAFVAARSGAMSAETSQRTRFSASEVPLDSVAAMAPCSERAPDWAVQYLGLHGAVDRLPPRERAVIHGVFFEDQSQVAVARSIGLSPAETCRTKQRALRALRHALAAALLLVVMPVASHAACEFTIAVRAPKYMALPGTCVADSTRPWAGLSDVAYLEVYGRAGTMVDGVETWDGVERFITIIDFDSTGADSLYHPVRVTPWHSLAFYRFRVEPVNIHQGRYLCAPPDDYYQPPIGQPGLRRACATGGDVWFPGKVD